MKFGRVSTYVIHMNRSYKEIYKNLPDNVKQRMNWAKGKNRANDPRVRIKYSEQEIFCENSIVSRAVVKRYLKSEPNYTHKCNNCGNTEWCNFKIILELEHINGNRQDHRRENLKWLCPNCHSITPTWRGRNIKKKDMIQDEEIIKIIPIKENISQVLIELGLAPYGGNYKRIKQLIKKYDVKFKETEVTPSTYRLITPLWRSTPRPNTRKVTRPGKEDLEQMLQTTPMTKIGEKFGVSDNAVRKWCKWYGLKVVAVKRFERIEDI